MEILLLGAGLVGLYFWMNRSSTTPSPSPTPGPGPGTKVSDTTGRQNVGGGLPTGGNDGTYTVVLGDTAAGIASKIVHDPVRYPELFAANPGKPLVWVYEGTNPLGNFRRLEFATNQGPTWIDTNAADQGTDWAGIIFERKGQDFASLRVGETLNLPPSWVGR